MERMELMAKYGFSAYELWKQSVAGGNINWPKDQTTMEHFFLYLKGKDGEKWYYSTCW